MGVVRRTGLASKCWSQDFPLGLETPPTPAFPPRMLIFISLLCAGKLALCFLTSTVQL